MDPDAGELVRRKLRVRGGGSQFGPGCGRWRSVTGLGKTATRRRVVIASGDPELRTSYRAALLRVDALLPGAHVTEASTVAELEDVLRDAVHCLVLDEQWAGDGLAALDRMQSEPDTRLDAVVYVLRSGAEEPDPAALTERGIFECVVAGTTDRTTLPVAVFSAFERVRKDSELSALVHTIRHELQNPLSSITMFLSLLAGSRDRLAPEFGEFIEQATTSSDRMRTLLRDLVAFVDAGSTSPLRQCVDAADVLRDVLGELTPEQRACVHVGTLPLVTVDPAALRTIWAEVIDNGLRYHGAASLSMRIASRRHGDRWEMTVTDNGVGIPRAEWERVFEPMVRLHAFDETPGSGMGLATCRRLVERHGGRMGVRSGPDGGAELWFTLPCCAL